MTWQEKFLSWQDDVLGDIAVQTWVIAYHHTGRLHSEPGGATVEIDGHDEVIENAVIRAVTEREVVQGGGQYQNGDILVRLQTTDVQLPCQPNDRFEHGDSYWQVLSVELITFRQRYRLIARRIEAV